MQHDIKHIGDRELLERIYAGQLRTQLDIELILNHVKQVHQFVNPDAFDRTKDGYSNPDLWRHYIEIHKDFGQAADQFQKDLDEQRKKEDGDGIAVW